ncbi:MAG: hypothetical protein ABFD62_16695 [Syntrophaceae bacterium]
MMLLQETGKKEPDRRKNAPVLNYNLFRYRRAISELHGKLSAFAVSDKFFHEYELALCEYFEWRDIVIEDEDFSEDLFQGENEISRFLAWYSLYFLTEEYKKTFPELFAAIKRKKLTPLEKEILEGFRHNPLGLFEVQKVIPGRGMYLKELFEGEVRFVHESAAAKHVCKWDILYAGLAGARGVYFLSDFGMIVIPPRLKSIVEKGIYSIYRVQRKNSRELRHFLRFRSAEVFAFIQNVIEDYESYHIKNAEGDPLLYSTLHYRIEDLPSFLEIIGGTSIFVQDHVEYGGPPENSTEEANIARAEYIWVKKEGKKSRSCENSTQGLILIEEGRLRARCNSRFRAEKLKAILAGVFGKTLAYECTIFEDQQFIMPDGPAPLIDEGLLECEEFRDILKEILARHYESWAEQKIPAIGNISPREAVKSPQGKLRVNDLLKELENRDERARRRGIKIADLMAFPADRIRKKLEL